MLGSAIGRAVAEALRRNPGDSVASRRLRNHSTRTKDRRQGGDTPRAYTDSASSGSVVRQWRLGHPAAGFRAIEEERADTGWAALLSALRPRLWLLHWLRRHRGDSDEASAHSVGAGADAKFGSDTHHAIRRSCRPTMHARAVALRRAPGIPPDCRYPSNNPCQSASLKCSGGSFVGDLLERATQADQVRVTPHARLAQADRDRSRSGTPSRHPPAGCCAHSDPRGTRRDRGTPG